MKLDKMEPGMVLLDIRKVSMGNTTMREWRVWRVEIVSVDTKARSAVVRWNGSQPETWGERRLSKLKLKKTKALIEQERRRQEQQERERERKARWDRAQGGS